MEYAESDSWVAVHLAQWFAALLLIGGFVALYYSITSNPEANAAVARFGFVATVLAGAALTMLQAVDGVALKWAMDTWASVPADQETAVRPAHANAKGRDEAANLGPRNLAMFEEKPSR
jgi:uncharacterized membrane protein